MSLKFVLATANKNKVKELKNILSALGFDAITQESAGLSLEPDETGKTFCENAQIKAEAVCKASNLPAIADDSGLMVSALDGAPGVYSKRFGDAGLDDTGRCVHLLQKLEGISDRSAKFVCAIVCVFPDGTLLKAEGECHGEILTEMRGTGGFGYDPVFMVSGTGKSMAELSAEEKNEVSHRGKALRAFALEMRKY